MLNKVANLNRHLKQHITQLHERYQGFRLYHLGSYALNRFTPNKGFTLRSNLAYGLKARQRLDVYLSDQPHPKNPLVVFVHGGAWQTGDKSAYRFLGHSLASEGFHVAVLNYHLAPAHVFPSSVQDLDLALHYLDAQQQALGISTQNVILMGHSAGAFNVMSWLYHPQPFKRPAHMQIRAAIGWAGPYHFDYQGDEICEVAFDLARPYTEVMPYYFVQANSIRHYLFTAAKDQVVAASNAQDLSAALAQVANHHVHIEIAKTGHVSLIGALSHWFSPYFQSKKQLVQALQETLAD